MDWQSQIHGVRWCGVLFSSAGAGLARLPLVWGDEERLRQVLTNLVSNAIKYSPDGGVIRIGGWLQPAHADAVPIDQPPAGVTARGKGVVSGRTVGDSVAGEGERIVDGDAEEAEVPRRAVPLLGPQPRELFRKENAS